MHLTLGNLELGTRPPAHVEQAIGKQARDLGTWTQSEVLYTGRHGREMDHLSLSEGAT